MCQDASAGGGAAVPDFTVHGVGAGGQGGAGAARLAAAHANHPTLHALGLQACVGASYNAGTNQICFTVPIYGDVCIPSPVHIPVDAGLKACVQTCGSFIPTGLQATIYLNGAAIYSGTVIGTC